jgi:hypothetical protein
MVDETRDRHRAMDPHGSLDGNKDRLKEEEEGSGYLKNTHLEL